MVRGKYKSRTYVRARVRTPGGKNVLRHSLRKPKKASCAGCSKPLHGVARARPAKLAKLPKSKRAPSRPFAGQLCSTCMRKELVRRVHSTA